MVDDQLLSDRSSVLLFLMLVQRQHELLISSSFLRTSRVLTYANYAISFGVSWFWHTKMPCMMPTSKIRSLLLFIYGVEITFVHFRTYSPSDSMLLMVMVAIIPQYCDAKVCLAWLCSTICIRGIVSQSILFRNIEAG